MIDPHLNAYNVSEVPTKLRKPSPAEIEARNFYEHAAESQPDGFISLSELRQKWADHWLQIMRAA